MEDFAYRDRRLHAEAAPLEAIAAAHGTPCYVYSAGAVARRVRELRAALGERPHRICYAVKANGNLAVLQLLRTLGCGFDIVSGGELARVRAAGGDPGDAVFSGVGKSTAELRGALAAGIGAVHAESREELARIERLAAERDAVAPVALRVNPALAELDTHPHLATGGAGCKFGVPMAEAFAAARAAAAAPRLRLRGLACHVGSQLTDLAPLAAAARELVALADRLRDAGAALEYLDFGGGLGVRYRDEAPPPAAAWAGALGAALGDRPLTLLLEPGRFLVGNAGVLLTRVEYLKRTAGGCFAVVDAAMTELLRPALYDAWHAILPVRRDLGREPVRCDVVGPVCETADRLGRDRTLAVAAGDLLAVFSAGAYAAAMGSAYNSRPAAAEVLVEGERVELVRARGRAEDLYAGERLRPETA